MGWLGSSGWKYFCSIMSIFIVLYLLKNNYKSFIAVKWAKCMREVCHYCAFVLYLLKNCKSPAAIKWPGTCDRKREKCVRSFSTIEFSL